MYLDIGFISGQSLGHFEGVVAGGIYLFTALALFLALRLVARGVGFGQCYGFNSSQSLGKGGLELDNVLASFVASHWVI